MSTTWRRVWWRRALQRVLTALHIALYRATGGAIGHRLGPLPNLLLTTTGRRTGRARTTALTYIRADGMLALIASNFGSRTAPQWYRNLQAHPEATAQLKRRRWPVHARLATPDERERIWPAALAIWPAWAGYAERAQREIPIVVLVPGGFTTEGTEGGGRQREEPPRDERGRPGRVRTNATHAKDARR